MNTHTVKSYLHEIPPTHAWVAKLKDGTIVQEGRDDIWWEKVKDDIEEISFFGLKLPVATKYEFGREALASPGASGAPVAVFIKAYTEDSIICFRFEKKPE